MKKLLLTSVLLVLAINLYSQNYITKTRSEIINNKGVPLKTGSTETNNNLEEYIYYKGNIGEMYYFNDENICIGYTITGYPEDSDKYLGELKKNYTKDSKGRWIGSIGTSRILAKIIYSEKTFSIVYRDGAYVVY